MKIKKVPLFVFSLYFGEGFPYAVVRQISTVFFKDMGASLEWVGLTSLYGFPYVFKFLWSPIVDRYSTKRRWIITIQFLISFLILSISFLTLFKFNLFFVALAFLILAFLSATNDIASDGYYLEALSREEQSKYVGFQSMSYRIALILGGGGIVYLASRIEFYGGFFVAFILFNLLSLYHYLFLKETELEKEGEKLLRKIIKSKIFYFFVFISVAFFYLLFKKREFLSEIPKYPVIPLLGGFIILILVLLPLFFPFIKCFFEKSESFYIKSFYHYLNRERVSYLVVFLILYRLGESMILNMLYPMLSSIGVTRGGYGIIYGTFGISASIMGGIVGGFLISKYGLKKVSWYLVLSQNIPNLLYAYLSFIYEGDLKIYLEKYLIISSFVVVEAFGAGLGTSFFMVLIMRSTLKEYKASNMATATALMNIAASTVGFFTGSLVKSVGFPLFFVITFVLTIPSMILLPFLPFLDEERKKDERSVVE